MGVSDSVGNWVYYHTLEKRKTKAAFRKLAFQNEATFYKYVVVVFK